MDLYNPNNIITLQQFRERYMKEIAFIEYYQNLRPSELRDFKKFFDCMQKWLIMVDRTSQGVDRSGKKYQFYEFIKARAVSGCKIFPIGEWDAMIDAYQNGELRIGFTGEELIAELLK